MKSGVREAHWNVSISRYGMGLALALAAGQIEFLRPGFIHSKISWEAEVPLPKS